ncbi:MAG: YdeI/OmpD-associated family protein [Saprospiraceae bacterium]
MGFSFTAKIYKVGINPCVDIPERISSMLLATKGYIPVKGKINQHFFQQTLYPVKDSPYRLYVNSPMMKGADVVVGAKAKFIIEEDDRPKTIIEMPAELKKELANHGVLHQFLQQTPSRQKEIFKYFSYLKTEEARNRNLEKIIAMMKEGS